jgi:CAF1 family ribonuclease
MLPYSFENLPTMDKNFTVSLNSFAFLAKNKFDFNKLFYESVGYLSHEDYARYKE